MMLKVFSLGQTWTQRCSSPRSSGSIPCKRFLFIDSTSPIPSRSRSPPSPRDYLRCTQFVSGRIFLRVGFSGVFFFCSSPLLFLSIPFPPSQLDLLFARVWPIPHESVPASYLSQVVFGNCYLTLILNFLFSPRLHSPSSLSAEAVRVLL